MKYLCILVLMCLWRDVEVSSLKYPSPLRTKVFEPEDGKTSFEITWDPVKNWDGDDPIVGYKLVIWEMKKNIKTVYKYVDGVLNKSEEVQDYSLQSGIPAGDPKVFDVTPDERRVIFDNVENDVWYEISALAVTKKGQGPLSSPVGIKVHPKKDKN